MFYVFAIQIMIMNSIMEDLTPVINSNIHNYCSPHKFAHSTVTRINPDKFTYLNSNLLVSNILNSKSHPQQADSPFTPTDAYTNKDIMLNEQLRREEQQKIKIQKTRQIAKCRSQTAFDEMRMKERQVQNLVEKVQLMKDEMSEKAKQILSKKDDNAYMGRGLLLEGEKFLKKMKNGNPIERILKIQATRTVMKENMKKKIQKVKPIHLLEESQISQNSLNSSLNLSNEAKQSIQKQKVHEEMSNKTLQNLIRNTNQNDIMKSLKRRASWTGFAEHWAAGFVKRNQIISTKKQNRFKKASQSPSKHEKTDEKEEMLTYKDQVSRQKVLKKYSRAFQTTAQSFKIQCK